MTENFESNKLKYPIVMVELMDFIKVQLKNDFPAQTDEHNQKLSNSIAIGISAYCGGRDFYLPKGDILKRALRDDEIYNLFMVEKRTIKELARKFNLSDRTVYAVIRRQSALRNSNQQ